MLKLLIREFKIEDIFAYADDKVICVYSNMNRNENSSFNTILIKYFEISLN